MSIHAKGASRLQEGIVIGTPKKLLYTSLTGSFRTQCKVMGTFFIATSVIMACMVIFVFFRISERPWLGILAGVFAVIASIHATRILLLKGVRIFSDSMIIPSANTGLRKLIPFSRVSEIRLNTGPSGQHPNIEVQTIDGKVERVGKHWVSASWEEFYRVMTKDLKDKVKVVE